MCTILSLHLQCDNHLEFMSKLKVTTLNTYSGLNFKYPHLAKLCKSGAYVYDTCD